MEMTFCQNIKKNKEKEFCFSFLIFEFFIFEFFIFEFFTFEVQMIEEKY